MKRKSSIEINMLEIKAISKPLQNVRAAAAKDTKHWGWELSWADFALAMSILSGQTYGTRIANRITHELGLTSSGDLDRGDSKSPNDEHEEIKGSLITSSNTALNLVQIRPWQDVNYIIYCFDVRDADNVITQFFYLTKQQMEKEMATCGTTSAHGTYNANLVNKHKELALRLDVDDPNYARWVKEYGVSLEDLEVKILNN